MIKSGGLTLSSPSYCQQPWDGQTTDETQNLKMPWFHNQCGLDEKWVNYSIWLFPVCCDVTSLCPLCPLLVGVCARWPSNAAPTNSVESVTCVVYSYLGKAGDTNMLCVVSPPDPTTHHTHQSTHIVVYIGGILTVCQLLLSCHKTYGLDTVRMPLVVISGVT